MCGVCVAFFAPRCPYARMRAPLACCVCGCWPLETPHALAAQHRCAVTRRSPASYVHSPAVWLLLGGGLSACVLYACAP